MLKLYLITLNCFLALICFLITSEIYKIFNYCNLTNKKLLYDKKTLEKTIHLSKVYMNYKEWILCIFILEKNIEYNKISLGRIYNSLGFCYYNAKNYIFAEHYYEKAIKNEPNNIVFLSNLAKMYTLNQEYQKAEQIYKKVLNIDNNNKKAQRQLLVLNKLI
uniref:Uncharacterized protein n=2 Tax=Kappaphycus TaxID=38543 RepID=A0A8E7PIC2_9FLOR|nr:hypothetical protein [Kappaphycus striatus]